MTIILAAAGRTFALGASDAKRTRVVGKDQPPVGGLTSVKLCMHASLPIVACVAGANLLAVVPVLRGMTTFRAQPALAVVQAALDSLPFIGDPLAMHKQFADAMVPYITNTAANYWRVLTELSRPVNPLVEVLIAWANGVVRTCFAVPGEDSVETRYAFDPQIMVLGPGKRTAEESSSFVELRRALDLGDFELASALARASLEAACAEEARLHGEAAEIGGSISVVARHVSVGNGS